MPVHPFLTLNSQSFSSLLLLTFKNDCGCVYMCVGIACMVRRVNEWSSRGRPGAAASVATLCWGGGDFRVEVYDSRFGCVLARIVDVGSVIPITTSYAVGPEDHCARPSCSATCDNSCKYLVGAGWHRRMGWGTCLGGLIRLGIGGLGTGIHGISLFAEGLVEVHWGEVRAHSSRENERSNYPRAYLAKLSTWWTSVWQEWVLTVERVWI